MTLRELIILCTVSVIALSQTHAQSYLLLRDRKNHSFSVGDPLTLKVDESKISGIISSFTDSSFFFQTRKEIPLRNIKTVYIPNPRRKSIGNVYTAAVLLPLADLINSGAPIANNVWRITAGIVGFGVLLEILHKGRIKIRSTAQMQIISKGLTDPENDG